jgi:hypothetical protein
VYVLPSFHEIACISRSYGVTSEYIKYLLHVTAFKRRDTFVRGSGLIIVKKI